jgi:hypothetical protein
MLEQVNQQVNQWIDECRGKLGTMHPNSLKVLYAADNARV